MKTQSKFQDSKSIVKLLMAASCGILLGSATVTTAEPAGTPVEQFHNHFTDSFSDQVVCDITVDVDVVVTDNFFLYADDSFKETSSMMATFTNPVNGKSVERGTVHGNGDRGRGGGHNHVLHLLQGSPGEDPDGEG